MPPPKAMTPMVRSATGRQGRASWIAVVEISASAKPKPKVRAFSRQGAGRSEMLAEIAPSVAGCPARKPKIAEATRATAMTPTPTLTPLTICWPTRSRTRLGGRQPNIGVPVRQACAARFNASIACAAVGLRPAFPVSEAAMISPIIFGVQ